MCENVTSHPGFCPGKHGLPVCEAADLPPRSLLPRATWYLSHCQLPCLVHGLLGHHQTVVSTLSDDIITNTFRRSWFHISCEHHTILNSNIF